MSDHSGRRPALVECAPLDFAGAPIQIEVSHAADALAGLALARNTPFPRRDIPLGSLNLSAPAAAGAVTLGDHLGTASFKVDGSTSSTLGVYLTASALVADLDPGGILDGLGLPAEAARFAAFRAMYDIGAAAQGALGLGPGATANFEAEARSGGFFAVIRAFERDPGARDAVGSLLSHWRLPRLIDSVDDLAPGAWIVAEVNGEFAARLGARFGYDYTWLRNVNAQGLTGDLMLRIQAAARVTLGFSASGRYYLTVAREPLDPASRIVRVRLAKASTRSWSAALSAAATFTPDTRDFAGAGLDGFIAAVFGVHGSQLFKDIGEWIDPAHPLHPRLARFAAHLARHVFGGEADIAAARERMGEAARQWAELPHRVTSWLWSRLDSGEAGFTAGLKSALESVVSLTPAEAAARFRQWLGEPAFLDTPAGGFLAALFERGLSGALFNSSEVEKARQYARTLLGLLNGQAVESLVSYSQRWLRVSGALLDEAAKSDRLEAFDPWLAGKLSKFIGRSAGTRHLAEIRKTLQTLTGKAEELSGAAAESLSRDWKFALDAAYSKATSGSALLDAELDFNVHPAAGDLLKAAIRGGFESLLLSPGPPGGVSVREAQLTHGVKRTGAVQVTLPYFKARIESINDSLAKMRFVPGEGGVVFSLDAGDDMFSRGRWRSTLSLAGTFGALAGSGAVNGFGTPEDFANLGCEYRLRLAVEEATTAQLQRIVEPLAGEYLPGRFGGDRGPVAEWVERLGAFATAREAGPGFLGRVALELTVALDGKTVAAWAKAPAKGQGGHAYARMSARLQNALRRLVPLCYFDTPARYGDLGAAYALLLYASLPPVAEPRLDFYFDYRDPARRRAIVTGPQVGARLAARLADARAILEASRGHGQLAGRFIADPIGVSHCVAAALGTPWLKDNGLFRAEARIIRGALHAGYAFARFRARAEEDFEAALEALSGFGSEITQAMNRNLPVLFGPHTLRAMAGALFAEAAGAFDGTVLLAPRSARLLTALVKDSAPAGVWKDAFLEMGEIPPEHVLATALISAGPRS
jgi:hypothetical protein